MEKYGSTQQKSRRRAQAVEFLNWGIYLVILGLVLGFGSIILNSFLTGASAPAANSIAANTINYANQGLGTMGQYLPIVALVVIAAGIITLIVRALIGAVGTGRSGSL